MPAHDAAGRDLALIEQAARDAGAIARRYFGGDYKRWDKGKGQPVTEADLAIDKFLNEALMLAPAATIATLRELHAYANAVSASANSMPTQMFPVTAKIVKRRVFQKICCERSSVKKRT